MTETILTVTFGPTSSPALPRAVAYAREHADAITSPERGVWRATFRLGMDQERYGHALRLIEFVSGWRCTDVAIDGEPEWTWAIRLMLGCARHWLRWRGACGEPVESRQATKCWSCPLSEHQGNPLSRTDPHVPDYPPEEWS